MKGGLRRELLDRRGALSPEQRSLDSRAAVRRLGSLPVARSAKVVLGYHPLGTEVDITDYLREACSLGRQVAMPRVEGDALVLHLWEPWDDLVVGLHGQREPLPTAPSVEPGLVEAAIVPGVGFDHAGHRLGFGRGFYDRLLASIPKERRIGIAFDAQVVQRLPREAHDAPMGWLVTPTRTLEFPPGH